MDRADWELIAVSLALAALNVLLIAALVYAFLPKMGYNG